MQDAAEDLESSALLGSQRHRLRPSYLGFGAAGAGAGAGAALGAALAAPEGLRSWPSRGAVEGLPPPVRPTCKYNARQVSSACALVQLRGSAFVLWPTLLRTSLYLAASAAVCGLVLLSSRRPELVRVERLCEVIRYSSALLGLFMVVFLFVALRRWHAVRTGTLGRFFASVSDLSMLLSAHFPLFAGDSEVKGLVLRYSLASFELMFMQAQGTDGVLGGLVHQQLLTDEEKRKLEELSSKPQAMWVWVASLLQRLAEHGRLSSRMLILLYGICARARGALGRGRGAFAYADTQLPFPYVHLLSVCVHLNSFAIAVKCGVVSAVAVWNMRRPEKESSPVSDSENLQVLLIQLCLVLGVPATCHAVLETAARLTEPFDAEEDKCQGLPRKGCRDWMRLECEALLAAGERLPAEALQVAGELEVRSEGEGLVHDYDVVLGGIPGVI